MKVGNPELTLPGVAKSMNDYFSPSIFHHPRHRRGSPPITAQTATDSMNRSGVWHDCGSGLRTSGRLGFQGERPVASGRRRAPT
jgi:hypothetical protein